MTCRLDRLCHPTWLDLRAVPIRSHTGSREQIFGPPKIGPDGYPGRHMARPSAILERFWFQNDPQNGATKWYNSDFGEIVIFATPPMRNQCFHCPGPFQKWWKISSKKDSATRPPQNPQFSTSGRLWVATWAEKASKRVPSGGAGSIKNSPEVEN